ncbi:MAG TPA: ATP-binding protein [Acidimicrobiales bacterium]|nr:ATP-binding protein [Acidimicrobiales bacterium]
MPDLSSDELHFVLHLPPHPVSVSVARCAVRAMRTWVTGDRLDRAQVIISEVVTNAVRHGSPGSDDLIVVDLAATHDVVTGCVTDRGPAFDVPASAPRPDRVGGFGLHIIGRMADTWSVDQLPTGNQVRFTV